MIAVTLQEFKLNIKNLLIWSLSVGILGFICTLMYQSMEGDMMDMADQFSKMGAFSDAFGMSTLSIATLPGFFATEVGTVHGLGSALFSAFLASCLLSKEEDGHTGEFLFSLPVSRWKVVTAKAIALLTHLVLFTVICGAFYFLAFAYLGEDIPTKDMMIFLFGMLLMNIEIGAISYLFSSISSKNRMGLGLGIALIFYSYDLIGRVVPSMKDYLFIGPFSYANASEIFAGKNAPEYSIIIAVIVIIATFGGAYITYTKRDLAS